MKIDSEKTNSIAVPDATRITIRSNLDTLELQRIGKPTWASATGRDAFGLWAEFMVVGFVPWGDQDRDSAFWKQMESWAGRRTIHGPKITSDGIEMSVVQRMRWIAPGRFMMGSPDDDNQALGSEKPQHEVTLSHGYWMFDTPVTQTLWTAIMHKNPSSYQGINRPVERVSWEDAQEFIARLNAAKQRLDVSLPTEAQWENACRSGTTTRYNVGDSINKDQAHFDSSDGTVDVKTHAPNAWGLYDMHGNVWQWCNDFSRRQYTSDPVTDPLGPDEGHDRVLRGGSWINRARHVRSSNRIASSPGNRFNRVGFRCAQVHLAGKVASKRSEGQGVATEEQP